MLLYCQRLQCLRYLIYGFNDKRWLGTALLARGYVAAPPTRMKYRTTTLLSGRLVSANQSILDLSGVTSGLVHFKGLPDESAARPVAAIKYYSSPWNGRAHEKFPPDTKGVFYYHQSKTFPRQLGELRFRLCSDSKAFRQGVDLCLPSGIPWCISSHSLTTRKGYRSICDHLVKEQLLDIGLYADFPESMFASSDNMVLNLGQPFVVDLSQRKMVLSLVSRRPHQALQKVNAWNSVRNVMDIASFSGRAIVRLEQYPLALRKRYYYEPLFAMRLLEAMTPIRRIATDGRMLEPVPGEFVSVRGFSMPPEPRPWGFSPAEPATRKIVTDWLEHETIQSLSH
ncbi:hypothetical protein D9619_003993 [Psilocybe cf. subviscida]|uniref:Uncharacterized protein n=1 Tax=Psilocybe cf. subviscida TaxID=2480587 RepID=A0A8H5F864_9AGAR|nr:hypothetical protein D9619_003993 [Psilocybe cf. subviscida]